MFGEADRLRFPEDWVLRLVFAVWLVLAIDDGHLLLEMGRAVEAPINHAFLVQLFAH